MHVYMVYTSLYVVYYMCNLKYVIKCLLYISKIKRILLIEMYRIRN